MALQAAVMNGFRLYSKIDAPILSVVAVPPGCEVDCDSERYRRRTAEAATQADDFARVNPHAQVVRLPKAGHFIWETNAQEVEQAMKAFLARLPKQR